MIEMKQWVLAFFLRTGLEYGKGNPTMERDQDDSRGLDDWPAATDMIQ